MMRLLRLVGLGTLGVALLSIAAGLAVLYGASRHDVKLLTIYKLEEATGLQIEAGERFDPVLWPVPGWQLGAVTVQDAETNPDAPLMSAQSSLLTLAPLGLLQGTWNIGSIWLQDVTLRIPSEAVEDLKLRVPVSDPYVSFLRLQNAQVHIGQEGSNGYQSASLDFASLDYAGARKPFRLAAQGMWRGRSIAAEAKLTSPDRAARGDWIFADAVVGIDDDTLTYAGRFQTRLIDGIPTVAGNVTATVVNPAGALSWLLQVPPDETLINLADVSLEGRIETLPERLLIRSRWAGAFNGTRLGVDATLRSETGWQQTGTGSLNAVARAPGLFSSYLNGSFAKDQGISGDLSLSVLDIPGMFAANLVPDDYQLTNARSGSVKGRLSASTEGVALADATLILGTGQYLGDAAIDLRGDRPILSLGTTLETLSLDDWVDPLRQGKKPLSVAFPVIDADLVLEVNAAETQYQDFTTGPLVAAMTTRPDAVEVDIRQLDIAGGIVSGSARFGTDARIAEVNLTGAELDSTALLEPLAMTGLRGILGGYLRAQIPLAPDTQGWAGIQADGTVSLFQTQIDGIDLRSGVSASDAQTSFIQADIDFTLKDQIVLASAITARDAVGEITGSGKVDLVDQTLDVTLTVDPEPAPRLRIGGTLGSPAILQPVDAASAAVQVEADAPVAPEAGGEDRETGVDQVSNPVVTEQSAERSDVENAEVSAAIENPPASSDTAEAIEPPAVEVESTLTSQPSVEDPLPVAAPSAPETAPLPRARQ